METRASRLGAAIHAKMRGDVRDADACSLPFESPSAMQIHEHFRLVSGLTGR